ncbi:Peroxin 13, N-terminal region-domain-containing protein [Entophlyctis helioformis]|nr:Peroxin 13, N-terminal region-domain-containing protein [Entophlyctis helioformis]
MPGPNGEMLGPNGEPPLTARLEQSTQATFQMLDQIVQAFGGFAQMLESTFFATHSSFMAMAGLAEQFGNVRSYLGQLLSFVSVVSAARKLVCWVRGRPPPADPAALTVDEFESFDKRPPATSRRPLWFFLALAVGLPWAMSKLVRMIQQRRLERAAAVAAVAPGTLVGPDGRTIAAGAPGQLTAQDPSQLHPSQIRDLDFCRALYAFPGDSPGDLPLRPGDIVAVLSKTDPVTGQPSQWWRGRTQAGQIGIFPSNFVEILAKKGTAATPAASLSAQAVQMPTPSTAVTAAAATAALPPIKQTAAVDGSGFDLYMSPDATAVAAASIPGALAPAKNTAFNIA